MMTKPSVLEPAVLRIGQHLAQLSAGRTPTVFDSRWWSQSVINLAMKDPAFKVQLFRFIDVLPAVASDQAVVRLAEEYFGALHGQVFGLQWGFKALTATNVGAAITGKSIRHQVEQMNPPAMHDRIPIDLASPPVSDLRKATVEIIALDRKNLAELSRRDEPAKLCEPR